MNVWTNDDSLLAEGLLQFCRKQKLQIGGGESCTGGLVSAILTSISGSSDVFSHAYITYSYGAKARMLSLPYSLISLRGAVDCEVALHMARANLAYVDVAYGITGVAGPGFSERKPAGLVCIAVSSKQSEKVNAYRFMGDRTAVRLASLRQTLFDLYQISVALSKGALRTR